MGVPGATVGKGNGCAVGPDVEGMALGFEEGATESVGDAVGAWSKSPVSASAQNARRSGDAASSSIDTSSVSAVDSIVNDRPATVPSNVNSIV